MNEAVQVSSEVLNTYFWAFAVTFACSSVIIIALIYFIRDMVQEKGNRRSEKDRICAAQFKNGCQATIELVKELHHEIHNENKIPLNDVADVPLEKKSLSQGKKKK